MAKQKKKKIFSNRIMTIAGLFTAGSVVGASVDFDSLLEWNHTIPSSQTSGVEEHTVVEGVNETVQDTIQVSVEPVDLETIVSDTSISETLQKDTEETDKEYLKPEQEAVGQTNFPDPYSPIPDIESVMVTEPEPSPALSDDWRNDDWMEAIFVPTTPPSEKTDSLSTLPDDWMEKNEDYVASDIVSANVSSMTAELAEMLEGIAVFWTPSGGKIHLNPSCRSFEENNVRYAGTLEEAQTVRTEGWCRLCAEHLTEMDNSEFYIEGNIYSTQEVLLNSYTYSDYCSGIPVN